MNIFHQALHKLIESGEFGANFDDHLDKNINAAIEILNINPEVLNIHDKSIRWKFISISLYILQSIKHDENLISINYINDIKKVFQFIVSLGILPNLIPGVGINLNKRVRNPENIPKECLSIEDSYRRLSGTVQGLLLCIKLNSLRNFVISNHLNDLLASLFQLCYAPIKKPSEPKVDGFVMTKEFYDEIMTNRKNYQQELDKLLFGIYSPQVIQELMFFYGNDTSPKWFKSVVYKILIKKLQQSDGVESLIKTVLDFEAPDTGAKWKQYDIIVKLLMTKPINFDDEYYQNISNQLLNLLEKKSQNNFHYIQIVSACVKYLFEKDKNNCEKYFLDILFSKLTNCLNISEDNIGIETNEFSNMASLWFTCFAETSPTLSSLPYHLLSPIIAVLFHIFVITNNKTDTKISENLKAILLKYVNDSLEAEKKDIFESFLFGWERNNIEITFQENIILFKKSNVKICLDPFNRSEAFFDLIKSTNTKNIIVPFCIYLLDLSVISSLPKTSNPDFLHLENESDLLLMDESTERKLISYKLLSDLIEDPAVHKHLQEHPENILNFIEKTLKKLIDNNLHKSSDFDDEQHQNMFKLIMILSIISGKISLSDSLINILKLIMNETRNIEMKMLISSICNTQPEKLGIKEQSKYEKALEDICDPLLPIRGHGLMSLAKLIEEKDEEACSNKQYILNVAQQFLKDEDSYIYLSAIQVLAALGDIFPDTVLNILAEEYSTGLKFEKNSETRMKLGEVLLRVIKSLGEVAPKYKSLLLNTFLSGVKDEDHLMRASNLSNLGEVCRVLGFKLGSVVSEVLNCIHAVIATDKAVEARRAAVSVIRYLFLGLEKETIVFLKEDILPIYRTLKVVYTSDPDDITRLQAQLALEELNANVREYLFSSVDMEKKILLLN